MTERPDDSDLNSARPQEGDDSEVDVDGTVSKRPRALSEIEKVERAIGHEVERRPLEQPEQIDLVRLLARRYSPSEVQLHIAKRYSVYITLPSIQRYGKSPKWAELLEEEHKTWIEQFTKDVPASMPEVRLRRLQSQLEDLDRLKALVDDQYHSELAAEEREILEQIRKEFGDRLTVTKPDGDDGLVLPVPMSDYEALGAMPPEEETETPLLSPKRPIQQ